MSVRLGLLCCRRTNGSIMMVRTFKHVGQFTSEEPTRAFYVNFVTQKNSSMQLFATLCVFQPLLSDLRQTSTERFVKLAVAPDLWT